MSEPLVTYMQDHLAGASHALDLLHWMGEAHTDSLGAFATALHSEISEDRNVLAAIAQQIGAGSSTAKETGAWLSEKMARLKFADRGSITVGTFESLEFLLLGIHGKRALWQALAVVARTDTRLGEVDYPRLVSRAEMQEARVDEKRLEIAGPALGKAR